MITNIKYCFMKRSRERKYKEFILLTKPSESSTLLDVGVADREFSPFDNYLEKEYPYPYRITALSIYSLNNFSKTYPAIQTVTYSGENFPFTDNEFSIVYSNAVVEHVGGFREQILFINEMNRVGYELYFTTPAKEFPIELHTNYPFIHWFPKRTFDRIVTSLGKKWASGNYVNLLRYSDLEHLLKASVVKEFKIFTHRVGPFPLHYGVWGR